MMAQCKEDIILQNSDSLEEQMLNAGVRRDRAFLRDETSSVSKISEIETSMQV